MWTELDHVSSLKEEQRPRKTLTKRRGASSESPLALIGSLALLPTGSTGFEEVSLACLNGANGGFVQATSLPVVSFPNATNKNC